MGTELANSSQIMADVEEGEISDSAEDFKKEDVDDVKQSSPKVTKDTRVWTMTDLYKYQMRGGYVSSLYNLAWAQAVQSKPLNDLFVEAEPEENKNDNNNSKRSSPSTSSVASVKSCSSKTGKRKAEEVVVDDSEDGGDVKVLEDVGKEEGELEEGEIDLDVIAKKAAGEEGKKKCDGGGVMSVDRLKSEELEKKVKSIRGALESVTVMEVTKSFQEVCSKLHSTLESLWELLLEIDVPTKSALSQLAFTAFGVISTVFSTLNHQLKEKNKVIFSRLLALVHSNNHHLFSPEQVREISVMGLSLDSRDDVSTMASGVKENESQIVGKANVNCASAETASHDMSTENKLPVTESLPQNKLIISLEASKAGLSNFRSRGLVLPLLDLHKDHDLDSLPSPTQETAPSLPVHRRVLPGGDGMMKSSFPTAKVAPDLREPRMHPYQTDAFTAFSSYQQKFGVGSLFSSDLHSPTPSEGSNDGDGDTDVEVSSSSTVSSLRNVDQPTVGQRIPPTPPPPPPPPFHDNFIPHGAIPVKNHAPISSGSISTVKASARSRDPRLRFVNNDASTLNHEQLAVPMENTASKMEPINLRKQKMVENSVVDGPAVKRHRSVWENPAANETRSGGWLEDTDMVGPQTVTRIQSAENVERDPRKKDNRVIYPGISAGSANGTGTSSLPNNVNEQVPVRGVRPNTINEPVPMTSNIVTALPDLLKDIAINPTILINLLKMGQQQRLALDSQSKVTEPAKNALHPLSSNPTVGVPAVASVDPALFSETFSRPTGKPQVPSQAGPMDELAKVRMKARDPRRILHNNTLQRSGRIGSEEFKTDINSPSTTNGSKDFQNLHKQDVKAEGKAVPLQSFAAPDISLQFTKSLKNIANIVSVSQAPSTQPFVSKNLSVSMQNNSDKVDPQAAMPNSGNQTGPAASAPETTTVGAHTQNAWGDVEHLFEGYDDKQKAAIQRERSRRIEEQKKLFAARKLCLVLDLDHTLLNSAKFVEVDPMHDEILRKKEEQDREQLHRHLYRFPHMGMWTKLRPGIWHFLERASKLFELHLYTMGNKLYATEMAKVLDPTGVLFSGRVISRGDDGDSFDNDDRVPKTKDLEGVLGMESGVVIIDDSVRVWPHNKLNLIVVERYIYFPCSRRQFGLPGPSLLEIDHDERSEDGTLASSLAVIERLHQIFFSHHALDEVDVRNILASEQRKILGGCRILFSRVIPVGESNPHLHPLWQTAEQFGAVCVNQIDEKVTHVVANSLGTDKVNWALTTGRFVVHPGWVEASALLYRRAREQDFVIKQ